LINASNYLFIDGSALTAQVRQLWRIKKELNNRRLSIIKLVAHFANSLPAIQYGGYKRASLYFPVGDEIAVGKFLVVPDPKKPEAVRDLHLTFCGQKLKKSTEFDRWVEENVPTKFLDRFTKSEKGIDIQICCDALKLASAGRIDRLFLLTNDSDFVPLCRSLREFGSNISILHLFHSGKANADLLPEADSFHVINDDKLEMVFEAAPVSDDAAGPQTAGSLGLDAAKAKSEKPVTEPSDLSLSDAADDEPGSSGE
jgi:uncharacterized LabA/DUF88 family protein